MSDLSWKPVDGRLGDLLHKSLPPECRDYIEVLPDNVVMSIHYPPWHKRYVEFPIKKDDVWVVSYPKCGTTWTQELVWCVMHGLQHPDSTLPLIKRFPFFEYDSLIPQDLKKQAGQTDDDPWLPGNTWHIVNNIPSPRTIKSHQHKSMLPLQIHQVKPKIVYVCRDPRDGCVSYFFHYVKLEGFTGELADFVELFLNDKLLWSPYWKHVLGFWQMRDQENLLFLRFEEMKEDLPAAVRKVAGFLGKALSEEDVLQIADHCSFDAMSKNKATNNEDILSLSEDKETAANMKFMRKGKVGDWKNHLTPDQVKAFKDWTMKNLEGTDFPYYRDYE